MDHDVRSVEARQWTLRSRVGATACRYDGHRERSAPRHRSRNEHHPRLARQCDAAVEIPRCPCPVALVGSVARASSRREREDRAPGRGNDLLHRNPPELGERERGLLQKLPYRSASPLHARRWDGGQTLERIRGADAAISVMTRRTRTTAHGWGSRLAGAPPVYPVLKAYGSVR